MIKKKRKCIILGGSGLLGQSIVKEIKDEFSLLTILDIKKPSKSILKNKNINFFNIDCSDILNLEKNLTKIIKKVGCPSVFINCSYPVADSWSKCNFLRINAKIFLENITPNLSSYAISSIYFAKKMTIKKFGSIINIGSIYGSVAQDASIYKGIKNYNENAVYPIVKSGLIGLTKQMASFFGKSGIRVNLLSPGGIYGHNKNDGKKQNNKFLKNYKNRVPMKRLGYSSEVAKAVKFLSTDQSSYITGTNLLVDGGWTII